MRMSLREEVTYGTCRTLTGITGRHHAFEVAVMAQDLNLLSILRRRTISLPD